MNVLAKRGVGRDESLRTRPLKAKTANKDITSEPARIPSAGRTATLVWHLIDIPSRLRQPRRRPQRSAVCGLPALCENGIRTQAPPLTTPANKSCCTSSSFSRGCPQNGPGPLCLIALYRVQSKPSGTGSRLSKTGGCAACPRSDYCAADGAHARTEYRAGSGFRRNAHPLERHGC